MATKKKGTDPIHIKPSHKGKFHEAMGVPKGQKITQAEIVRGEHSKSPAVRKEANFADVAKNKFNKQRGGNRGK